MSDKVYQSVVDHHSGDGNAALTGFVEYLVKEKAATDIEKVVAVAVQNVQTVEEDSNELIEMSVVQTAGAKKALDKAIAAKIDVAEENVDEEIKPGKECVRQGCKTVYSNAESLKVKCVHHPGHPVFHETYKYWSCCSRVKKYCFDEFRALPGCRDGPETCAFTQAAAGFAKKAACRHDFFQVGSTVTLNIYAKKVDPSRCSFLISPKQLRISIYFDLGKVCFFILIIVLCIPYLNI